MRYFITAVIVLCTSFKCTSQLMPDKIIGVNIRTANPYWTNYAEDIKTQRLENIRKAITRNIANLSLLEYAFVLDQLCVLLKDEVMRTKWSIFLDNQNRRDPIVLLGVKFLKSSIDLNDYLKKDYQSQYDFIKKSLIIFPEIVLTPERLDSLLEYRGFSEVVGEGKIFDLLVIDNTSVIRKIDSNQKIKLRYETWLNNLGDDAYGFWFSDDRPSEMFVRERQFLINRLRESKSPLSQKSATAIEGMVVVRIHPNKNGYPLGYQDNPTDKDLLVGTWFGQFSETKKIILRILTINGKKVFGQSRMWNEDDTHLVSFEGDYTEVDKKFNLILKEPEKDKPFNGVFELTIDRFSLEMQGKWISYNKQLTRKFQIEKNPLVQGPSK